LEEHTQVEVVVETTEAAEELGKQAVAMVGTLLMEILPAATLVQVEAEVEQLIQAPQRQ
jgi:hypothetical protein